MRILVSLKLSYDVSQMKYDDARLTPILDAVSRAIGEADRCGLEEALRLRERLGGRVDGLTIGSSKSHRKMAMDAYAMGVDKMYIIEVDRYDELSIPSMARIITGFVKRYGPYDLIIGGSASQDTHMGILLPAVSSMLGLPIIVGADRVDVGDDGSFIIECTYEDGRYRYSVRPPFVLTVTSEINEPRIPTIRDILKAKKMGFELIDAGTLVDRVDYVDVLGVEKHIVERRRVKIYALTEEDIEEAVDKIVEVIFGGE